MSNPQDLNTLVPAKTDQNVPQVANPVIMNPNQMPANPQMVQMFPQFQPMNMAQMQPNMAMNPMMMPQNFLFNPQTGQMVPHMPQFQMMPMQMVNFAQGQQMAPQPFPGQFMPQMMPMQNIQPLQNLPAPSPGQQDDQQKNQNDNSDSKNATSAPKVSFQQVFQPMPMGQMGQVPQYVPINMPNQQFLTPMTPQPQPKQDSKHVPQDYVKGRKHKIKKVSRARNHINYSDLHGKDVNNEQAQQQPVDKKKQNEVQNQKSKPGKDKKPVEKEDPKGKLSMGGLLNPTFISKEEIQKWLKARRKNFPTRKNIEEKRLRQEKGEEEGELNEQELSKLELKLRKKIMILTSDPREERKRQKEMRFLFRNLTCIKKRKPQKNKNDSKAPEEAKSKHKRKQKWNKKKHLEQEEKLEEEKEEKLGKKETVSSSSSDNGDAPQEVKMVKDEPVERIEPAHIIKIDPAEKLEAEEATKLEQSNTEEPAAQVKKVKFTEDTKPEATSSKEEPKPERRSKPPRKSHSYQEIISHLSSKRDEDEAMIQNFLSDKPNSDRFRYQQNTLLTSLLIDEVYTERSTMLKVLRYFKKHNFLQPEEEKKVEKEENVEA